MLAAVSNYSVRPGHAQKTLDFWQTVSGIPTGIVVLGLVGEYVAGFSIKVRRTTKERLAKISILVPPFA